MRKKLPPSFYAVKMLGGKPSTVVVGTKAPVKPPHPNGMAPVLGQGVKVVAAQRAATSVAPVEYLGTYQKRPE